MRQKATDKIFVLGIDGMDPRLTKKYLAEGKLPNTQKLIDRGSCRDDLVMLGAQPTVTPPMWTTMATGAYPCTHGITCFYRQSKDDLSIREYNLDSTNCTAEPLWNVFAEAGKKTLVWHWPGSSWPPTSDNPNLHVVDGTQPAAINMGVATTELDFILVANTKVEEPHFRAKAAADANVPCVLADLEVEENAGESASVLERITSKGMARLLLSPEDGENSLSEAPFDVVLSPIKEPTNWADAPAGAKEFVLLLGNGLIRRPGLILKNEQGIYDTAVIYKNKKAVEPIVVLPLGVFVKDVIDESIKHDQVIMANRSMRLLEVAEDGSKLKLWVSGALDISNDTLWHPHKLFKDVAANVGYPRIFAILGGADKQLLEDCMLASWDAVLDWNAAALKHLIQSENYEIVFSQVHSIDAQGHMIVKFLKDKGNSRLTEAEYAAILERMYTQADDYIGELLYLLDKDWTIFLISDHGQICPEHEPPMLGDMGGLNVRLMQQLGFTDIKRDADGNDLYEIDWSKTKAIANRGNHIYLNIKGRNPQGIVDPAEQYELEEEIITALYGYKDPKTGKRVIALALRNKDAYLLGMGGPECGDILYWLAEGYNYDHCDSLSTTFGYADTSVSPIFVAAGKGIKENFTTDRIIRQVDLVPTMAVLGGVRMPAQCEGAPVYQILSEEF